MTQPPQEQPDYPWGPSETDRAERASAAPDPAPSSGGSTRMGSSAPHTGTPYTGTPHTGGQRTGTPYPAESGASGTGPAEQAAPVYTGTSMDQLPPLGPPTGGYAGTPSPRSDAEAGAPVSTIVLLVVSGIAVLTGFFTLAGIPALVLAIVALTRAGTDPAAARRLTRTGWWVFVGLIVLGLVLAGIGIALLIAFGSAFGTGPGTDPFGATSTALTALVGR